MKFVLATLIWVACLWPGAALAQPAVHAALTALTTGPEISLQPQSLKSSTYETILVRTTEAAKPALAVGPLRLTLPHQRPIAVVKNTVIRAHQPHTCTHTLAVPLTPIARVTNHQP